jgi:N-acetylglucosaminyldiphosphoundecaprenol N-acetyl-beta-D-mannosaminyltransferase
MISQRTVSIFGVRICDVEMQQAIVLISQLIQSRSSLAHAIYFANAHTLNLAFRDPGYRQALLEASHVFGDGTGVRWGARLRGVRMRDNVNGTDMVPALLSSFVYQGYSYFMLGADAPTIAKAAGVARARFQGWHQAGFHHGYLVDSRANDEVIAHINSVAPDVLLVGMGNPRQEFWIQRHRSSLRVQVCLAVGGLFDFWAGNVSRAPHWLRKAGCEWIWRLIQQPADKASRYLGGNPLYLLRVMQHRRIDKRHE